MPSDQPTIDDVRKHCGEPEAYVFEFPPSGYFGVYVKTGRGRPARLGFGSSIGQACEDAIAKHDAAVASLAPAEGQNCPGCSKTLWGNSETLVCGACGVTHDKRIHSPSGVTWKELYLPMRELAMSYEMAAGEILHTTKPLTDEQLAKMEALGHTLPRRLIQVDREVDGKLDEAIILTRAMAEHGRMAKILREQGLPRAPVRYLRQVHHDRDENGGDWYIYASEDVREQIDGPWPGAWLKYDVSSHAWKPSEKGPTSAG